MGKYQVFSMKDPAVRVITTIEAPSKEAAQAKARAMNPDYAVVAVLGKAGSQARESGRSLRNVQLREDAHNLARVLDAVTRAIQDSNVSAQDIEILDDNSARFRVGDQLFSLAWAVATGDDGSPAVTLGDPQKGDMVFKPTEAYRGLLRVSEAMNPGRDDSFHAEFLRGPAGSSGSLEELGRVWGNEGEYLESFLKGR